MFEAPSYDAQETFETETNPPVIQMDASTTSDDQAERTTQEDRSIKDTELASLLFTCCSTGTHCAQDTQDAPGHDSDSLYSPPSDDIFGDDENMNGDQGSMPSPPIDDEESTTLEVSRKERFVAEQEEDNDHVEDEATPVASPAPQPAVSLKQDTSHDIAEESDVPAVTLPTSPAAFSLKNTQDDENHVLPVTENESMTLLDDDPSSARGDATTNEDEEFDDFMQEFVNVGDGSVEEEPDTQPGDSADSSVPHKSNSPVAVVNTLSTSDAVSTAVPRDDITRSSPPIEHSTSVEERFVSPGVGGIRDLPEPLPVSFEEREETVQVTSHVQSLSSPPLPSVPIETLANQSPVIATLPDAQEADSYANSLIGERLQSVEAQQPPVEEDLDSIGKPSASSITEKPSNLLPDPSVSSSHDTEADATAQIPASGDAILDEKPQSSASNTSMASLFSASDIRFEFSCQFLIFVSLI